MGATLDLRRYVLIARAKSNSRGLSEKGRALSLSLSVCLCLSLCLSMCVCVRPRGDISRVLTYYADTILHTVFFVIALSPRFVFHYFKYYRPQ